MGKYRKILFYTADYNGVWNLFLHPQEGEKSFNNNVNGKIQFPITNVLTGLQQPTISLDDNSLIFAGYSGIGWDLYRLTQPLKLSKKTVEPTQFIKNYKLDNDDIVDLRKHKSNNFDQIGLASYSDWVFARGYENFNSLHRN